MSIFSRLLNVLNNKLLTKSDFNNTNSFNWEEYDNYNNIRIKEFKNKYDLNSIAGIRSIPKEEAMRYSDGGISVVYMPEQILNRCATEYKSNNQFELAIECLKKANEMYPLSFYYYSRDNYERLVNFLVLAGEFDKAKEEHKRLDKLYGTKLDELHKLQKICIDRKTESKEDYQKRVIDPYIDESKDREQYYWLLENIPEIAPSSFGGYRRMKRIKSNTYKRIVYEVEKKGYEIENISFWE